MSLINLRDAMVFVFDADAAVRAFTGRNELNLIPRKANMHEVNVPVATYFIITSPDALGTSGHRDVSVQIEVWAEDHVSGVFTTLEGLMDRAEALFTGKALAAATPSVDCAVRPIISRVDVPPEGTKVRGMRADFNIDLTN